jgi:hypothetical protein
MSSAVSATPKWISEYLLDNPALLVECTKLDGHKFTASKFCIPFHALCSCFVTKGLCFMEKRKLISFV